MQPPYTGQSSSSIETGNNKRRKHRENNMLKWYFSLFLIMALCLRAVTADRRAPVGSHTVERPEHYGPGTPCHDAYLYNMTCYDVRRLYRSAEDMCSRFEIRYNICCRYCANHTKK